MEYCLTRDQDGTLKLHEITSKFPRVSMYGDHWIGDYIRLNPDLFPEVVFENSPKRVSIDVNSFVFIDEVPEEQSSEVPQVLSDVDSEPNTNPD